MCKFDLTFHVIECCFEPLLRGLEVKHEGMTPQGQPLGSLSVTTGEHPKKLAVYETSRSLKKRLISIIAQYTPK